MKTKMIIKDQNGQAITEFAIMLPLLIIVVFAIVEFGLLLYNTQMITNASREGARAGIVVGLDRETDEPKTVSENAATVYCRDYLVTFSDTPTFSALATFSSGARFGDPLTVTVTYLYDYLVLSAFGFDPITLTQTTVMRFE